MFKAVLKLWDHSPSNKNNSKLVYNNFNNPLKVMETSYVCLRKTTASFHFYLLSTIIYSITKIINSWHKLSCRIKRTETDFKQLQK